MTIKVLLVDDHPVVRTGLRAVLEAYDDIEVVGEASSGEEALTRQAELAPEVVLCDLRLGDGMNGIAATKALRALPAPPAVIMLTTFDRDAEVAGAIEAGAAGYLLKDVDPATIVEGIRTVAGGGTYMTAEVTSKLMAGMRGSIDRLTDRELEVMQLLATGASNREMAKTMFVSEATVKSHLVHIFTKLQVDSRSRAVHVARERGIIDA